MRVRTVPYPTVQLSQCSTYVSTVSKYRTRNLKGLLIEVLFLWRERS